MSFLHQAINEARFFRRHPAADRMTFPVAWQFIADDPSRSSLVAGSGTQEKVRTIRLDSLNAPRPIHFIKIDVEGAERLARRGAEKILQADLPIIQFESTPGLAPSYGCEPDALWQLLVAECGYKIYQGPNLMPGSALPEEVATCIRSTLKDRNPGNYYNPYRVEHRHG